MYSFIKAALAMLLLHSKRKVTNTEISARDWGQPGRGQTVLHWEKYGRLWEFE